MIAVSSWAVHPLMVGSRFDAPDRPDAAFGEDGGTLTLESLPGELAERGYRRAEICHFHLPSLAPHRLARFRRAFEEAGVTVQTLLVDAGDLTHPEHGARDAAWIRRYLDVAAEIGAEGARVIAGKTAGPGALDVAVERLGALADASPVRVRTENWFDVLADAGAVERLLDALGGRVGFNGDFGNWPEGQTRAELGRIMARAETVHAKADFLPSGEVSPRFAEWVALSRAAGYAGPWTLVAAGPGDPWTGLAKSAAVIGSA